MADAPMDPITLHETLLPLLRGAASLTRGYSYLLRRHLFTGEESADALLLIAHQLDEAVTFLREHAAVTWTLPVPRPGGPA